MPKKVWCTYNVVVLLIKTIAFMTSSLPSPSSDLKVPILFVSLVLKKCTNVTVTDQFCQCTSDQRSWKILNFGSFYCKLENILNVITRMSLHILIKRKSFSIYLSQKERTIAVNRRQIRRNVVTLIFGSITVNSIPWTYMLEAIQKHIVTLNKKLHYTV